LNKPKKRNLIKDYINDNNIDIIGLQETKMESIPDHILFNISCNITEWFVKSSVGNSYDILVGINNSLFSILNVWVIDFLISILLTNKNNNFSWLLTFVYGSVLSYKFFFLFELRAISQIGYDFWLVGGDFNLIRKK
jgi:Endonuclease/Exonuclease/phosphatase family